MFIRLLLLLLIHERNDVDYLLPPGSFLFAKLFSFRCFLIIFADCVRINFNIHSLQYFLESTVQYRIMYDIR